MRNVIELLILAGLMLAMFMWASGCVFYRHDVKCNYDSKTYCSLFKNFNIDLDPNSASVTSRSKNVKAITPWGGLDATEDVD